MNFRIRKIRSTDIEFEVYFAGKKHIISSSRLQIVDLLFSTYENAVIKNEELQKTNHELKLTQTQLFHAKKMASLGVLTAGIAHEINNPINFIYSGINSLKQDFDEITPIIQMCNKISNGNLESLDKLKEIKANIDFDDIMEAIPQTIEDIKYGAHRTTEIIKGLRNFSRVDPTSKQSTNIHEGIDSTLLLLKNKCNSHIEIIKKFDEKMPKIMAFAGELNQVFMNLISNAIDAILSKQSEANNNGFKGIIKIITRQVSENHIYISISDNGPGISREIIDNIFDPFFTTKDIGKGTGLGLAISHGIMEKHNGNIRVESKIGKGTKFIIELPIQFRKTINSSKL
jgi:signal transduction histidine kinase